MFNHVGICAQKGRNKSTQCPDLRQDSSLPRIVQIPYLMSQHGYPDHPKNLIYCSLRRCRAILNCIKIFP